MSKHTPGPWTLTMGPTEVSGVNVRIEIHSQDGHCVTSGQSQEHLNEEFGTGILEAECRANGRLIAAAPELLEALQAIAQFIPSTSAADGGAAKYSDNVKAADMVRAAIAKATGEPA